MVSGAAYFSLSTVTQWEPWNTVDKPSETNFSTVRDTLMRVVPLALDSDPSLIPLSCKAPANTSPGEVSSLPITEGGEDGATATAREHEDRDPDDFTFWSERQAKRICAAIKQVFDVDYAPEVVVADANLTALANRILVSKELLSGRPQNPG